MNKAVATRLFGLLLVGSSCGFIGYLLWTQWEAMAQLELGRRELLSALVAALIYTLACWPLAAGWRLLVNAFSDNKLSARLGRHIFARSQLAKYLPGNVMHIAGRHLMARAAGVPHAALVTATLLEIASLVAAAGILSIPGLVIYGSSLSQWNMPYLALTAGVLVAGALVLPWLYRKLTKRLGIAEMPVDQNLPRQLALTLLRYVGFFLLAGLSLCLIAIPLLDSFSLGTTPLLVFVFCFSWAVGFLTPGAPSGIGIREAVIVLLLGDMTGAAGATLIALLLRLVTVLGDLGFFALDSLLTRLDRENCAL